MSISVPTSGPVSDLHAHLRRLRHDLRTPITGILGYSELVQEDCPDHLRPDLAEDLHVLVAASRALAAAVAEGSDQVEGRADAATLTPHRLADLMGEILAPHLMAVLAAAERSLVRLRNRHPGIAEDLHRVVSDGQTLLGLIGGRTALPASHESSGIALLLDQGQVGQDLTGMVLIVDDNATGREVLARRLTRAGHRVEIAENARQGRERLARGGVDLVLSDVLLPGEDGLQFCRRIRQDPATASVPVILVTALQERSDRLAGIAAGAMDFLSKPIDGPDLLLRVRNALRIKRQYDEAVAAHRRLSELERLRDNLTHLIVHDLRQPLAGLCGYLELYLQRAEGQADPRLSELVGKAEGQARQLTDLVNQVLDVSRLEAGRMPLSATEGDLADTVQRGIISLGSLAERVPIDVQVDPAVPLVACDHPLVARTVANLVGNAIRFTPAGKAITVRLRRFAERGARIEVADVGPGIDPAYHQRIFEKFGQVSARQERQAVSSGLGLFFCRLAVEAHGGRIEVESAPGKGSLFWFTLPGSSARS